MSDPNNEEPFFIGWEEKPAAPVSAFNKKVSVALVVIAIVVAGIVAAAQRTISTAWFDFGNVQEFTGVLIKSPTPMLITDNEVEGEKIFYLVARNKYGFPEAVAEKHHLQQIKLMGTFLGDELEAMIEVVDGSVSAMGKTDTMPLPESEIGTATVRGEIVDSKCHLGLMNPGRFKPHRACAIQCLMGGIPPILVAQTPQGQLAHYLLVSTDGSAINDAVLDYVAEPVEVTGTLKRVGDRGVLYIDPATINRL
ncbi:MAG: hypothetical protein O7C75_13435 [Verrucomicrobia bacterium]|nr:hypothetical protein [Verrucomicrobiota bacterium]